MRLIDLLKPFYTFLSTKQHTLHQTTPLWDRAKLYLIRILIKARSFTNSHQKTKFPNMINHQFTPVGPFRRFEFILYSVDILLITSRKPGLVHMHKLTYYLVNRPLNEIKL